MASADFLHKLHAMCRAADFLQGYDGIELGLYIFFLLKNFRKFACVIFFPYSHGYII
jgi:hypothetical protein